MYHYSWGNIDDSGIDYSITDSITNNFQSYAIINKDGSVQAFGINADGESLTTPTDVSGDLNGTIPVVEIFSNFNARVFSALRNDGSLITWGLQTRGGDSSVLSPVGENITSGVVKVESSIFASCALKEDGITPGEYKIVAWGDATKGGDLTYPTDISSLVTSGVKSVVSGRAFAALKNDGSVVVWGSPTDGGDTSVGSGGIVTWGYVGRGADSSSVNSSIKDVQTVYNAYDSYVVSTY